MTSNYTPPNLVTPTSGGNAGDGTIAGKLTVKNGIVIGPTNTTLDANPAYYGLYIGANTSGTVSLGKSGSDNIYFQCKLTAFNAINTTGYGLPPIFGLDNRTGLTATDSAAKTLYTSTAASQVYRVTARVFGKSGTISSAVYTIGWTEGGTSMTETVSISAVSTMDSAVFLLQPDNDTAITVQPTTLSGTSPVVDVAATLEQMA